MTSPAGRQRNPSFNVAGLSRQCVVIVDVYRLARMFNEDYGHNSACSSRSSACRRSPSAPGICCQINFIPSDTCALCFETSGPPREPLFPSSRGIHLFRNLSPLSRQPALMRPLSDSPNSLHSLVRCLSGAVKPRMLCRSLTSIRGTVAALSTQANKPILIFQPCNSETCNTLNFYRPLRGFRNLRSPRGTSLPLFEGNSPFPKPVAP